MGIIDITVAWHRDLVITTRDCTLDRHAASYLARVLVLPARQLLNVVPAWQFHINLCHFNIAVLVALTTTLVLAVVAAAIDFES